MRLVPNFKGFDFFPHDLRLPFMKYRDLAVGLSIVGMLLSLGLFFTRGLNYGVDFKGGTMIEVQSKDGAADIGAMREKLGKLGLGGVQIQQFGAPTDVLIRIEQQPGGDEREEHRIGSGLGVLAHRAEPAASCSWMIVGISPNR